MRNFTNLGGVFNMIGLAETEGEVKVKEGNGTLIWGYYHKCPVLFFKLPKM